MGIKKDSRALFVKAAKETIAYLGLPDIKVSKRASGTFDYIHVFSKTQVDLQKQFVRLRSYLAATGMLWVSWPKGKQMKSDLDIKSVIRIGYDNGLVESKAISLDATWSALKFTHPKMGKVYNNSYGKLPE